MGTKHRRAVLPAKPKRVVLSLSTMLKVIQEAAEVSQQNQGYISSTAWAENKIRRALGIGNLNAVNPAYMPRVSLPEFLVQEAEARGLDIEEILKS